MHAAQYQEVEKVVDSGMVGTAHLCDIALEVDAAGKQCIASSPARAREFYDELLSGTAVDISEARWYAANALVVNGWSAAKLARRLS